MPREITIHNYEGFGEATRKLINLLVGRLVAALAVLTYIYYNSARSNRLMEKYITESRASRIKGKVIVSIYVAISFSSIFAVAFFLPGKL